MCIKNDKILSTTIRLLRSILLISILFAHESTGQSISAMPSHKNKILVKVDGDGINEEYVLFKIRKKIPTTYEVISYYQYYKNTDDIKDHDQILGVICIKYEVPEYKSFSNQTDFVEYKEIKTVTWKQYGFYINAVFSSRLRSNWEKISRVHQIPVDEWYKKEIRGFEHKKEMFFNSLKDLSFTKQDKLYMLSDLNLSLILPHYKYIRNSEKQSFANYPTKDSTNNNFDIGWGLGINFHLSRDRDFLYPTGLGASVGYKFSMYNDTKTGASCYINAFDLMSTYSKSF
mgnify:CR=1 FL=1